MAYPPEPVEIRPKLIPTTPRQQRLNDAWAYIRTIALSPTKEKDTSDESC